MRCKIMLVIVYILLQTKQLPSCTPVPAVASTADDNIQIENVSQDEKIAVETILLEDQSSYDGALGVAEVIRNRMKASGKSAYQVCTKPYQFSCWNNTKTSQRRLAVVTPEQYQRAAKAWAESESTNTAKGAKFYHADYIKQPRWAKNMKETTRIGRHVFLSDKK